MTTHGKPTICVRGGEQTGHSAGVVTPVHPSTSYRYRATDGHVYPRYFNTPNQQVVVEKIRLLEGAEAGLLFGSGMAAISSTFLGILAQGDHVVLSDQLYGGTYDLVVSEFARIGVSWNMVDARDPQAVEAAIRPDSRALYLESPSNPLLQVLDLEALSALARERGLVSIIDNTFASPINQNPIEHGIDLVVHSATKYLGGHSDLCLGVVVGARAQMDSIMEVARRYGGSTNALDCYLLERSLKTLAVRVERQNANAMEIARFLDAHDAVREVHYPGLPSHDGHEIARRQMRGFGGMLSFELAQDESEAVERFVDALSVVHASLSLGGVESMLCPPATTSHAALSPQERADRGISDGLLRLSVGIEEAADLIADLEGALAAGVG
jgi:cystathionine beta-lyase